MYRRKKLASVLAIALLLLCLTACSQSVAHSPADSPSSIAASDTDTENEVSLYFPTNMENEVLRANFASGIENVEELYEQSDNIVVALVTGYETYSDDFSSAVFSKATIQETLKGDLQTGDEITVSETGEHLKDGNDRSVDGIPLLFPGMKVILFLGSEGPLRDATKTGYGLTGSYVGKFIYHPDGTIYNFSLLGEKPILTLSDVTGPLTEEEFRALLPQENTTTAGETTVETTTIVE